MTDEKKPRKPRGPNKTFQQRLELKHRQLEVAEKRAAREADKVAHLREVIDAMIDQERAKHEAALEALGAK